MTGAEKQRRYRLRHPERVHAPYRKDKPRVTIRTRWQQYALSANKRAKKLGLEGRLAWSPALELGPCHYCGGPSVTWDHVVPLSRQGPNDISNLVPACHACNQRKSARSAESFRSEPLAYRLLCGWCWSPLTRTRKAVRRAEGIGVRTFVCGQSCGARLSSGPPLVDDPNAHTAYMREWRVRRRMSA